MSHQLPELPELPETPYLTFWREEATPMNPFHAEHFKFSDAKSLPWGRQNLVRLYTADQMHAYAEQAIASVKREPLSDMQITELDLPGMIYVDIVRAIEAAHGITKDPNHG